MITRTPQTSPHKDATISSGDATSIKALLALMANEKKISEETIRNMVSGRFGVSFGVDDIKNLPRNKYNDVFRFLVDLRDDMDRLTNA